MGEDEKCIHHFRKPLGKIGSKWQGIDMNLKKIWVVGLDWIYLP
jgi:hypothetical protein